MATKKVYIGRRRELEGYECIPFDRNNLRTILNLPYKNCSIEEVIIENVLEFIPPDQLTEALNEWRRVIALGGRFLLLYADVVRAAFLYQRKAISFDQLQEAMRPEYRTALCYDKLDSLLVLRYPEIHEQFQFPFNKKKKLWHIVLSATKGRLG